MGMLRDTAGDLINYQTRGSMLCVMPETVMCETMLLGVVSGLAGLLMLSWTYLPKGPTFDVIAMHPY